MTDKTPVFIKARSLPLAMREPMEKELWVLEAEGRIYKVDYSDCGTPIVSGGKKLGEIRICGVYNDTVNPKLVRGSYTPPRTEELFAQLSGCEQFSKINLSNAYQRLELHETLQSYTATTRFTPILGRLFINVRR